MISVIIFIGYDATHIIKKVLKIWGGGVELCFWIIFVAAMFESTKI